MKTNQVVDKRDQLFELLRHLKQRAGDGPWLLDMLFFCTCDGGYPEFKSKHPFFKKDYRPPTKALKVEKLEVDDADNFLKGLPPNKKSKNGKVRN